MVSPPNGGPRMKILVILAQKGGSGKSTVTVHLAACAMQQGYQTVMLDVDPQGTSYNWNERREAASQLSAAKISAVEIPPHLTIAKKEKIDLVVIDTSPRSDSDAATVAHLADFILIPCRASIADLETVSTTAQICKAARKPFAVILNAAPRSKVTTEARAALEAIDIPVLIPVMHHRIAYSHAMNDGRAVHEFEPGGKASVEIQELYSEVCRKISLTRRSATV